jgi:HSP20 family protein
MAQSQGNLSQRQPSQRSLIPQSLMNFPIFSHLPSFLGDMGEEWNWMSQLQQNISLYEDDKNIIAEAALPGLSINEIDVSIDHGILRIQGERKTEDLTNKKVHCTATSSYSYRITLPQQVDDKAEPKATYKDGVLKLTFAKANGAQTKKINIKPA